MEEIQSEGLLVSWMFKDRPDLNLSVLPRLQLREVSGKEWEAGLEWRKGGRGRNSTEPGGKLMQSGGVGNSLLWPFRARKGILSPWSRY